MNIDIKKTIRMEFTEYCEEEKKEKEISIDYRENPMLGVLEKYYKKNFLL